MEEVKQDQGPGEGAAAATIVKPDKSYKPAPKAPAAKNTNDVKKAMLLKKKANDAAWINMELRDKGLSSFLLNKTF